MTLDRPSAQTSATLRRLALPADPTYDQMMNYLHDGHPGAAMWCTESGCEAVTTGALVASGEPDGDW